jgi:nitrogen-specific signal transduction histidine kinase
VDDDGPGVDEATRTALQTALDSERYDGRTGLGLMLADRVARAHGGRVVLPPVAAGFAVELQLGPAASSPT